MKAAYHLGSLCSTCRIQVAHLDKPQVCRARVRVGIKVRSVHVPRYFGQLLRVNACPHLPERSGLVPINVGAAGHPSMTSGALELPGPQLFATSDRKSRHNSKQRNTTSIYLPATKQSFDIR